MYRSLLLYVLIFVLGASSSPARAQSAASFAYPQSVFVDSPNGHIWVADFDNHRVLRFNVSTLTSAERARDAAVPGEQMLTQNYPNPFNPSTRMSFALAKTGRASVTVFDLLGREVASVFDGIATAHSVYSIAFDAAGLPSGVYVYALRSESGTIVKKMCVVK